MSKFVRYFFIIEINKEHINFYTDIVGNYRVYYYQERNYLYITDDLNSIFKKKNYLHWIKILLIFIN